MDQVVTIEPNKAEPKSLVSDTPSGWFREVVSVAATFVHGRQYGWDVFCTDGCIRLALGDKLYVKAEA